MNLLFPMMFRTTRYLAYELNDALKPFELHQAQWAILHLLYVNGEMPLTTIWKTLLVEAPTVTRTVKRLEELGYVTRQQGVDKREKIIALTPLANEKAPMILEAIERYEETMMAPLTLEEQQQLFQLLAKVKGEKDGK